MFDRSGSQFCSCSSDLSGTTEYESTIDRSISTTFFGWLKTAVNPASLTSINFTLSGNSEASDRTLSMVNSLFLQPCMKVMSVCTL